MPGAAAPAALVTVGEELNFGRAAERLRIAGPSLSRQIKALKRDPKVRLFDRDRRSVTRTPSGAALLPHGRALVEQADELRRRAAGLVSRRQAEIAPPQIMATATIFSN